MPVEPEAAVTPPGLSPPWKPVLLRDTACSSYLPSSRLWMAKRPSLSVCSPMCQRSVPTLRRWICAWDTGLPFGSLTTPEMDNWRSMRSVSDLGDHFWSEMFFRSFRSFGGPM